MEVVEGDALKLLPEIANYQLKTTNYKLVGNIPYYITGYLLRTVSELKHKPSLIVLMIQKEVAERICAKPGEMNLLAASIQVWAKVEIVRFVSKKSFNPSPKVDSAIIKLIPTKNYPLPTKNYYTLLRVIFRQPRKTVWNNLRQLTIDGRELGKDKILEKLSSLGIEPTARPQNLTIENLKTLAKIFV